LKVFFFQKLQEQQVRIAAAQEAFSKRSILRRREAKSAYIPRMSSRQSARAHCNANLPVCQSAEMIAFYLFIFVGLLHRS